MYGHLLYIKNAMKTSRLDTRITPEQRELYERAVALGHYSSLTEFLTSAAEKCAKEIIAEHEQLVLSENDKAFFIDLLENPPQPNEALRQAAQDYSNIL